MKTNYFIFALMLVLGFSVKAQTIVNGTLDVTPNCNSDRFSRINCVDGWYASHGSPSTGGSISTNNWLWTWSHSGRGEGVFTNYQFQSGKKYVVIFDMRTTLNKGTNAGDGKVFVRATSGLSNNVSSYGGSIPAVASSSELLYTKPVSQNLGDWKTVAVSYKATKNNTQLWFYPYKTGSGVQAQMEIDNIKVIAVDEVICSSNDSKEVYDNKDSDNDNEGSDPVLTEKIRIYPNPVQLGKRFKIKVKDAKLVKTITVTSVFGRTINVKFRVLNNNIIEVYPTYIPLGVNVVKVFKSNSSVSGQLIVRKGGKAISAK